MSSTPPPSPWAASNLSSYLADVDTDPAYTPDTEVIADGYFHESEYRSAPYFDLRIDGINLLDEVLSYFLEFRTGHAFRRAIPLESGTARESLASVCNGIGIPDLRYPNDDTPRNERLSGPFRRERSDCLGSVNAIRMEHITKRFGSVVANNDINFELHKGEILSLLGENGSGKTTLMNMLSGIYFPDEGQIYVNDQPVTIASPKDAFDLRHRHDPPALQAGGRVHRRGEHRPGPGGRGRQLDVKKAGQKIREICEQIRL